MGIPVHLLPPPHPSRLRELESLASVKPEESPDGVCRFDDIPQTAMEAVYFYYEGKVK